MRKFPLAILLVIVLLPAAIPGFAQLPSQTVTITATRSIAVAPDQALLTLTVTSRPETNLDQIVGALSGLGITPLNLSGVDNYSATMLQWNFDLAVPLSNLTATIASVTNLQQTIGQHRSGLALTFNVSGLQASAQAQGSGQAQMCTNADLIADATAQAQKLVSAAGATLGSIVQVSTVQLAPIAEPASYGLLSAVLGPVPNLYFAPASYSPPLTCTLSVQFQLLP